MPFWFWNDVLDQREIIHQIADFQAHGVHGFVIHPRVGLPRDISWMSDAMLDFMQVAIDEAARRDMRVILYDEGMYPSGSSSGQVVAENPAFACRGLAKILVPTGSKLNLSDDQNVLLRTTCAGGEDLVVIDRKVDSFIRGLHYINEGPAEDEPAMADILNPLAVQAFIRLVYDRFASRFSRHFGKTIVGIFTDEPNALGRCRETDVAPGTTGIIEHVSAILGYDFTPHLPALWFDDVPDAAHYRSEYHRAVKRRMEQTWYTPLSAWCRSHGVWLCGHPSSGEEIGAQRYFDAPGQDLVWRFVVPSKPSALEGGESTQAKSASSAMIHYNRRRNSNEFCGAYGPQTTFEECKWLADWCLVRGANLLIPHAFYYSIRGPRKNERPPQLGPHSSWWDQFKPFADHCARLCWVNADARHVCRIAILAHPDQCPWPAAKACFQHQRDFNYLDTQLLNDLAEIDATGITIAGMHYQLLIVDQQKDLTLAMLAKLKPMMDSGRVLTFDPHCSVGGVPGLPLAKNAEELIALIDLLSDPDIQFSPSNVDLRYRHMVKEGNDYYLLFNEGNASLRGKLTFATLQKKRWWIDLATGQAAPIGDDVAVQLMPYEMKLLGCSS